MKEIRFFSGRKHILKRTHEDISGLSEFEIYQRKQASRLRREEQAKEDTRIDEYINWIKEIQKELGISKKEFGKRLGVTVQTINLWYNKKGHFPSQRTFNKLLSLEKEAAIKVTVLENNIGIKVG
jgi:DNA-binding transcriptional regulator YiaG